MMTSLTPKQEAFAQAVASGMSQSDAYRASFKVRPTTKPESVNQSASTIMANVNVSSRVAELRKPVAAAAQMTLASHLERLSELSAEAQKSGQMSAAIAAEVARGKASGLYIERTEISGGIKVEASLRVDSLSTAALVEIMKAKDNASNAG